MKRLFCRAWIAALFLTACGDDSLTAVIFEDVIVDSTPTIAPGAFVSYDFVVDLSVMIGPIVTGVFDTNLGTPGTIQFFILTEESFALWQNAESFTAVFATGQTEGGEFEIPINVSGNLRLVLSNPADATDDRMVGILASLVFQQEQ